MSNVLIPQPPSPWKHVKTWPISGLVQMGYSENSDLLLVLSAQGAGVFDCLTGEKIARDYADIYTTFNSINLIASGIGPLAGVSIRTSGLFGGELKRSTEDNWQIEIIGSPNNPIVGLLNHQLGIKTAVPITSSGITELRAYGFSDTGRSCIVGWSSDLDIFMRSDI